MNKIVSVIIPMYNAGKTIFQCISTVLENTYANFEVLVINDISTDKSLEILSSIKDKRLKLFSNKNKLSASLSRNFGIKHSSGELIILLDSDTYVPKHWILNHVLAHESINSGIVGGGVIGVHKTIFGEADSFCNWWTSLPHGKPYYLKKLHIPTNNLSIDRKIFDKIGYFKQILKGVGDGGEDAEFCFRALKSNIKIYVDPSIIAYHYDRDNFKDFLKHQQNWGRHAVMMRKLLKMEYSFMMPKNYFMAHLYIIPLAILYTGFIVKRWLLYRPSVVLYSPLIFLGKLFQTNEIKNSFKNVEQIKKKN